MSQPVDQLDQEFAALAPWHTQFLLNGRKYGGGPFFPDGKMEAEFFEHFPEARGGRVLEPGSCEGGRTVYLAAQAKHVTCLEGRAESIRRARFAVAEAAGYRNVDFFEEDLETMDWPDRTKKDEPNFHAAYVSGVLYHLQDPWRFLAGLANVTDRIFVWTHYCAASEATFVLRGVPGLRYEEPESVFAGLRPWTFWPTLPGLLDMVRAHFEPVVLRTAAHQHGPVVVFKATR